MMKSEGRLASSTALRYIFRFVVVHRAPIGNPDRSSLGAGENEVQKNGGGDDDSDKGSGGDTGGG